MWRKDENEIIMLIERQGNGEEVIREKKISSSSHFSFKSPHLTSSHWDLFVNQIKLFLTYEKPKKISWRGIMLIFVPFSLLQPS